MKQPMVSVIGRAVVTCQDGKPIALLKRTDMTQESWDTSGVPHEHFAEEIAAILTLTAAQEFGAKLERDRIDVQVYHWEFDINDELEGEGE